MSDMQASGQKLFSLASLRKALSQTFMTVCVGFTCLTVPMLLFRRAITSSLEQSSNRQVLGLGFYLSALLFFFAVGLFRQLKFIPKLKRVFYRLLHFLLSSVMFYLCFFPLWNSLSLSYGELAGTLDTGELNLRNIIFGYTIFLVFYFLVVGLRAFAASRAAKREAERKVYEGMLQKSERAKKPDKGE